MNNKRNAATERSDPDQRSGHVQHDDRGNAVWITAVGQRLEHQELALIDEQPARNMLTANASGLRTGYNPYDSGMLPKKACRRRKDLRALSKWIEAKKSRGESADE